MASRKSCAYEHFVLNDTGSFKCGVTDDAGKSCGKVVSQKTGGSGSTPVFNMKRHLKRYHEAVFRRVMDTDAPPPKSARTGQAAASGKKSQQSLNRYFETSTAVVSITKDDYTDALVSMVANDSLALSFFSSSVGFRKIAEPIAKKLKVSLDRDAVREMVVDRARRLELDLIRYMKNKSVFLKIDGATRLRSSCLAINVQHVQNRKSTIKTLAVVDCAGKHSAAATVELVKKVVQRYELKKDQLLAIITDNARAMLKTVELLNRAEEQESDEHGNINVTPEEDASEADDYDDDLGDLVVDAFEETTSSAPDTTICTVRCAAHTLQLAIRDGLKQQGASTVLAQAHNVAKKLRAPNMLSSLKSKGQLLPIIDVETRWGSSYLMLKRLLTLKDVVQDYAAVAHDLHMPEKTWQQVQKLADILEQPYAVTIRLQSADLTAETFFKEWCRLRELLEKEGAIGAAIAASMKQREEKMLESDVLLAAIYADTRYRILLGARLEKAGQAFVRITERVGRVHGTTPSADSPTTNSSSEQEDDLFERELHRLERSQTVKKASSSTLDAAISDLRNIGRMQGTTVWDIVDKYPSAIQQTSMVLAALPVTQVSVERLFSAMKLLLTDLRSRLKQNILEAMLLLRSNREWLV